MSLLRRGTGALTDFVEVLRQVRTDEIAAEAEQHFEIAVVGAPGAGKTTLIRSLASGTFGGLLEPFGIRRLLELEAPLSPAALQTAYQADLVLWLQDVTDPYLDDSFGLLRGHAPAFLSVGNKADLLAGIQNSEFRIQNSVEETAGAVLISAASSENVRQELVPAVLQRVPDLALALGRTFASFRPAVAEREIQRVARVNAEVAVVSAIPQASLILGPVSAVADTLLLTKNQAILLLRLATLYGLSLDRGRLLELVPIVGAAFGWRTLARELVGFLPAGFGVVPKAVIAYAGTVATGRAALWYYETGRKMPENQLRQIYSESSARARDLVREITQRLKRAG
ncbi:MAG TPA: hypothetical protein VK457_11225 [Chloroflexota bacterium]|nr:hypothetical protein [Chloroflexota bacterium]